MSQIFVNGSSCSSIRAPNDLGDTLVSPKRQVHKANMPNLQSCRQVCHARWQAEHRAAGMRLAAAIVTMWKVHADLPCETINMMAQLLKEWWMAESSQRPLLNDLFGIDKHESRDYPNWNAAQQLHMYNFFCRVCNHYYYFATFFEHRFGTWFGCGKNKDPRYRQPFPKALLGTKAAETTIRTRRTRNMEQSMACKKVRKRKRGQEIRYEKPTTYPWLLRFNRTNRKRFLSRQCKCCPEKDVPELTQLEITMTGKNPYNWRACNTEFLHVDHVDGELGCKDIV